MMNERFYTPKQVAEILQVHQYTVLKWIREGKLRALKFGRVYRTTESELKAFLGQTAHDSAQDVVRAAAMHAGQPGYMIAPTLEQVTLPIPSRLPTPTPDVAEVQMQAQAKAQQQQARASEPAYAAPTSYQQPYYPQSYQPAPLHQPTPTYSIPTPAPVNDQIYSLNIEP